MLKGLDQLSLPRVDTGGFAFGRSRPAAPFDAPPDNWRDWLQQLFPASVADGFAEHHAEFWEWLWSIEPDSDPAPLVGIWPRGHGKTSSAELATVALGLRGKRRYALYIRDTQNRADDAIGNIGALLEARGVERAVGKYGDSRGWRRNRLRAADGYTVDAIGLDTAARGIKLEDQRPDVQIYDDIDNRHDSQRATEKKTATITDSLLPAGTSNAAIIAIQNLIVPNGLFARLADGRADFLHRRRVSGPHPSVRGLVTEKQRDQTGAIRHVITDGDPTWAGQDLDACQRLIDRSGLASFLRENQHQVQDREGALWSRDLLDRSRVGEHPTLIRVAVGVDPSGGGDDIGIIVSGKGADGHGYTLEDRSQPGSLGPANWGRAVVNAYHDWQADVVVGEGNFGGDMVRYTIHTIDATANFKLVNASRGKAIRAEPVASLHEEERQHHVGTHDALETECTSWAPNDPDSPNRMDAKVWAETELMLGGAGPSLAFV